MASPTITRNGGKAILVIGGYGTVGSVVSRLLIEHGIGDVLVAGRSAERARTYAGTAGAGWRCVDLADRASTSVALDGIDAVINCFAGPFTGFNLWLPELVAERGLVYLDVCGSFSYSDRVLGLHDRAAACGALLVTALGANPGVAGLLLASNRDLFDTVDEAEISFAMGSRLSNVSAAGLQELRHMFAVKPLVWHEGQWRPPEQASRRAYVAAPFNRQIYFGAGITRDIMCLPELFPLDKIACWSGMESTAQVAVMYLGFKLGLAGSDRTAAPFLRLLRWIGSGKAYSDNLAILMACRGTRGGIAVRRVAQVTGDENHVTAAAAVAACEQMLGGRVIPPGAYLGPQALDAAGFLRALPAYGVQYDESEPGPL